MLSSENPDTVTLSRKEYENLIADSVTLECLNAGGVDNWEWYGESMTDYDSILESRLKDGNKT